MKNGKFTAVGFTCGIGSLLIGAKMAGFDVIGNIEWRKYYHHTDKNGENCFKKNFPGAFFVENQDGLTPEMLERMEDLDFACGHPECGNFSNLRIDKTAALDDPGDIPLFIEMVAKFKPKYFMMDDLPKAFMAYSMEEYAKMLPDYDLFPEWISNYNYGNIQKHRKRFFMLGARKDQKFTFVPGETENTRTLRDILAGCEGLPNHDPHTTTANTGRSCGLYESGKNEPWSDLRDYFLKVKPGTTLRYHARDGEVKNRIGLCATHIDGHCHVLTGTNPIIHPETGLPFSLRERLRIQGAPDDFELVGTVMEEDGTWNHDRNSNLVKCTGKFMPVQFGIYFASLCMANLLGETFESSGERMLPPNEYIDEAKQWYCRNVGYGERQAEVCSACWMPGCKALNNSDFEQVDGFLADMKMPAAPKVPKARAPRAPRGTQHGRPKEFDPERFKPVPGKLKLATVVREFQAGKTIAEVAATLGSTEGNVRSHLQNLTNKHGIGYQVRGQLVTILAPDGVELFR